MPDAVRGSMLCGMQQMTVYLVECFASGPDAVAASRRLSRACDELRADGGEVTYLGTLVMTDDETAFHVLRAAGLAMVTAAGQRAAVRAERVVAGVAIGFATGSAGGRASPARTALGIQVEGDRSVAHAPGEIGPGADT